MIKQYMTLPRPVLILCLGTFINRTGSMMVVFLTFYLKDELGLTVEFASLAPAAYGVGALVAAVLGGHLADLIGRRIVMLASMFGGGAILLVFGHLTSPVSIIVAAGLFAVVMESYRPAASAMIADLVEHDQRTRAFGLMYVSINLGAAIAPLLANFLIHTYSFLWLFRVDALTSIAYATLILVTIAETLPSRRAAPVDGQAPRQSNAGQKDDDRSDTSSISFVAAVVHILRDRAFLIFCLATLCLASAYSQAITTFPLYLSELGLKSKYAYIIAVNGIMIVCLQLPVTAVIMRHSRTNMMILGAVLTAAGFGLIGLAHSVGLLVLTVVIWTFGEMMFAPLVPAIVTDMAPVNMRARYMGALTVCFSLGMITVPIAGMVLQRLGGGWLWGGTLAVGILAACLYGSIRPHIDRIAQDQS
ncbi:MAG: MFS transporter [Planctomycetes bacterium]|nr:MFS transporter [Planctomycetota bacterium]